ncbi:MAG: glycosyltransferase family 4 protein [bacterium]
MKIAMCTPYFRPHTGGTEKYVEDLSIQLVKHGHEVTVFASDSPKKAHAPLEEVYEGIKIKRFPSLDIFYLPITRPFNLKLLEGFDIVHSHSPSFGFTRSIDKKLNIPHVVTYHCDITYTGKVAGITVPKWFTYLLEYFADRYGKKVLKHVDGIITTTESYASSSRVASSYPHYAIPIGIHYEKFDKILEKIKDEPRKQFQILFLGRLAANKGVNFLVEAMPMIFKKFPQAKLVISGEGEEKPGLIAQIKKLGIGESVQFMGKMGLEDLVRLYGKSTVFVLPSINKLEAFGIVQLEAMACWTPVIASDIPGVNNVMEAGKSGFIVPKENHTALADAIMKLLADPKLVESMGRRGRELVEQKYNWNVIASQIEGVYRELIAKKKAELSR